MLFYIATVVVIWLSYRWYRSLQTVGNYGNRYVVITGCDTGFGNMLTKRLDSLGFHVYAGCLTRQGMEQLDTETSTKVKTIELDVSKTESILSAFQIVQLDLPKGKGLWALVNNAGILGNAGPSQWMKKDDYISVLEINTLGVVETSRIFLPLLIQSKGRIVNVTSVNGRLGTPGNAPYVVSKFAVEGFSDVLRRELYKRGVTVHILTPGGFATGILDTDKIAKSVDAKYKTLSKDMREYYGDDFSNQFSTLMKRGIGILTSSNIGRVIDTYTHAVTAKYPKYRYIVGNDARFLFRPLWMLPEVIVDYILGSKMPIPSAERIYYKT